MGDAGLFFEFVVLFDRGRRRGEMTIRVVGEALSYRIGLYQAELQIEV